MALATALGWGNVAQIAAAVCLAYLFGFALTARPLVAAGLGAAAVVSTALAADTVSITIMEAIDNLTIVLIPNVMNAGLTDALFYGSIAAGFAIAYPFAFYGEPLPHRPRQGSRRSPRTSPDRRPSGRAGLNRNVWDAREPIPELIRSRALDPCEVVRPAVPLSELAEAEHASEGTEALSTWASERVRYDHAGCWCVD